jgi:putative transposase
VEDKSPQHHRRSIRLKGYDYTQSGAYFVTICAYQGEEIFGNIAEERIQLSRLGEIIQREWLHSLEIRKEIQLFADEFVVMPNHVHGIVWIVGADGVRPDFGIRQINEEGTRRVPLRMNSHSLGSFISGFKAAVTSQVRKEMAITNIWHRNYYEHIIRNENELRKIWDYIDTNPAHWKEERLNQKSNL